ncbi:hypothetical protein os4_37040 (plasmid) [Comamonadaceae bacterium OS-4]|nr:hypothetical protein os4_37040 [Comamonadaceae bacterium OS-4]
MPQDPTQTQQELAGLVRAIQRDVLEMIRNGQIPVDVKDFAELHDHCDANCLGGLCIEKNFDALIAKYGGRDHNEGMPQGMLDLVNGAQNAVNLWIQGSGHTVLAKLPPQAKRQIQGTLSNDEVSSDQEIVDFWVKGCGIAPEAADMAILFRDKHLTEPLYEFFTYQDINTQPAT